MSSPITFSGFNNIDFNTVLESLMAQASQPLTNLQTQQSNLKSQVSNYGTLNTDLSALSDAADALSTLSSVTTLSGTSTDPAVAVSTDSTAVAGHYDVTVTSIARAQVTATTTTAPDATSTIVASGGSLTIGGTTVSISGDVTLQQLADAINGTAGIGVNASVVRTGTNAYKLALTSLSTGTANAFTVTNNLGAGSGGTVAFSATNAVDASDASIVFNNIEATSSSNTFENIVPGVTLTVSQKDATKTIGVDVAPDSSDLTDKVNDFITAYNNVITFIDSQRTAANNGDATSIGHDALLRQLRSGLRDQLLGAHGSAAIQRLTEVGVEFTTNGTLSLDQATFDAAVSSNGDQVRQLFAGTDGVFPAVESMLNGYAQSGGIIPSVEDQMNKQVSAMDDQIAQMQNRLALQRQSLQQEFTAADQAISALNSQSSSLSNLGTSLSQSSI